MMLVVPRILRPTSRQAFKALSTCLLWVVYALSFILLAPYIGDPTGILVLLPVTLSAWFWGLRVGAVLGVGGGLLNFVLYLTTGLIGEAPWVIAVPSLVTIGAGLLIGYLRDLHQTLKQQNLLIRYQADHDALTGLRNRAAFVREATRLLETAHVDNLIGLLYLDLDGFKGVNDRWGHAAGDVLLIAAADRLRQATRHSDLCARLGGDEFVVVLPQLTSAGDAERLAQEIYATLRSPYTVGGIRLNVSASLGVSIFPGDGERLDELLHHADQNMYQAKARNKDEQGLSYKVESETVERLVS